MSCVLEQASDGTSISGWRSFEEEVLLEAMPSSSESIEASVNQQEKSEETNNTSRLTPKSRDAPLVDTSNANSLTEYMSKTTDQNGNVLGEPSKFSSNEEKQHINKPIIHSEEEEIAFLRSLGWKENSDDDEGLTPEEILDFCNKV
ncbi:hypothetical protein TSUD_83960 [Trifolium subterraneum]|uniref:Uncharacterized protein n=1 Tax=Trifolium subterraneum TaxID=3900 RepID=A0A2Z6LXC2_TRISU|nr:hypothetical protein TSUD_83960 [Trifolium subterraneum]